MFVKLNSLSGEVWINTDNIATMTARDEHTSTINIDGAPMFIAMPLADLLVAIGITPDNKQTLNE